MTIRRRHLALALLTGDPNGPGLPKWPAANSGSTVQVIHLDVNSRIEPETMRDRYLFLDQAFLKK